MLFSSIAFLYRFMIVVLLIYWAAPKKLKNSVLLLSSLCFYAYGERERVWIFMAVMLLGWLLGLLIEKTRGKKSSGLFLLAGILGSIGLLGYYKYTDFVLSNIQRLAGMEEKLLHIVMPIGISFYTFQILGYLIDVYWGSVKAQKNPIYFASYVSAFPQLIAGPIVRYRDVEPQLKERSQTMEDIAVGLRRFIFGLSKKVLIANVLGELTVQFRVSTEPSVLYYWLYAIAYMLHIYFDFSGYSDMAIGLGKMMGFHWMENFNYPYISASVTEFWRRWHISLGTWFRDYVYIPLGGNRKGSGRQLFNILVVWMLTGLWHGAAWNFVLWGLFYAVFLMLEKLGLKKFLDRHKVIAHGYTLLLVCLGFVLFNAESLSQVVSDYRGLFGLLGIPLVSGEAVFALRNFFGPILLGIVFSTPLISGLLEKGRKKGMEKAINAAEPVCLLLLLIICSAYLVDGSFNPFLYFRF